MSAILLLVLGATTVRTDATKVELGRGFPLVVTRSWSREESPPDFAEASLAPLVLKLLGTSRREEAGVTRETRRYLAYAFRPGKVTLPEALTGGAPVVIDVVGVLDPKAPGPPELPPGPLSHPSSRTAIWLLAAALLAAGALLLVARRRAAARRSPAPPATGAPAPPTPAERTLGRLRGLSEREPEGREAIRAWHDEATLVLREYLDERFALPAGKRTSEEVAGAEGVPPPARPLLWDALRASDLVKFGRHLSTPPERARLLEAAEGSVREAEA
jgi:hypothetical protein